MKKIKGIIPEVKMSAINVEGVMNLKPYKILSVNTNSLFDGKLGLLDIIRKAFPEKFLIRKDFIMIPRQIKESKEAGADAVLIIRDFLTSNQYDVLIQTCEKEHIIPITETQQIIIHIGKIVLVNSRNLNTGKFYRKQAEEVCREYKAWNKNVIYASGEDSDRVIKEGIADAVLIGTKFMQGKLK